MRPARAVWRFLNTLPWVDLAILITAVAVAIWETAGDVRIGFAAFVLLVMAIALVMVMRRLDEARAQAVRAHARAIAAETKLAQRQAADTYWSPAVPERLRLINGRES